MSDDIDYTDFQCLPLLLQLLLGYGGLEPGKALSQEMMQLVEDDVGLSAPTKVD
jgi:hypothetical protein